MYVHGIRYFYPTKVFEVSSQESKKYSLSELCSRVQSALSLVPNDSHHRSYTNVPLTFLSAQLGVDFTHVLNKPSIHTLHNQHVDLFRIEKRIPLVSHVIGLRKNTLTETHYSQVVSFLPSENATEGGLCWRDNSSGKIKRSNAGTSDHLRRYRLQWFRTETAQNITK